jgi:AhpC/TSA family
MLQFVNNSYAYAMKYDSAEIVEAAMDSCWKFLKVYPRSFAKPGIFGYMVKMAIMDSLKNAALSALIDSSLYYDSSSVNKYGIAEVLIESNMETQKGYSLLREAYPHLTAPYHKYEANILFARKAIKEGQPALAKMYFDKALSADSTRIEGWYEYASFLTYTEQKVGLQGVKNHIDQLNKINNKVYDEYSKSSPNIGKQFLNFKLRDLDGNLIDFKRYKGKPLIAQYFSNWCPQPEKYLVLKDVSKEFPNAKIVLINILESPEELKTEYLSKPEYKYLKDYTIVFEDSTLWSHFTDETMGTLFLVDKNGKIILDLKRYAKDYEKLLKKALKKIEDRK